MFRVNRLDHVALTVRDVQRSIAWYRDVLGLERRHEQAWGDYPVMLFAGDTKGLALDTERLVLKVVEADDPSVIVHDPKNRGVAAMLIEMPQGFPVALGVIYEDPAPTFESAVIEQSAAIASGKKADLQALVSKGQTWQVEKEPHKL